MHEAWRILQWLAGALAVHGPLQWDEARQAVAVGGDAAGKGVGAAPCDDAVDSGAGGAMAQGSGGTAHGGPRGASGAPTRSRSAGAGVALRLRDVTLLHDGRRTPLQGRSGSDVLDAIGGEQPQSIVDAAPRRIDVEPADGLWLAELLASTVDLFHAMGADAVVVGPDLSLRADATVAGVAARLDLVLDDGRTGPAWSITLPAPAGRLPPLRMGRWAPRDGEVTAVLPIEERHEGMDQVGAFFTGVARLVATAG